MPNAALRNYQLYERLALVDALRAGDARVRKLARDELLQVSESPAKRVCKPTVPKRSTSATSTPKTSRSSAALGGLP